jgi:hypothetical protein
MHVAHLAGAGTMQHNALERQLISIPWLVAVMVMAVLAACCCWGVGAVSVPAFLTLLGMK